MKSHAASAASIMCAIRTRSSARILDTRAAQHLVSEIGGKIVRCPQVDAPSAEKRRQLALHLRKTQEARFLARLELDQQIHVAGREGSSGQCRTEQGQPPNSMLRTDRTKTLSSSCKLFIGRALFDVIPRILSILAAEVLPVKSRRTWLLPTRLLRPNRSPNGLARAPGVRTPGATAASTAPTPPSRAPAAKHRSSRASATARQRRVAGIADGDQHVAHEPVAPDALDRRAAEAIRGTPHRPASPAPRAAARQFDARMKRDLARRLRELVPRAHREAIVAAIDAIADRARGIRARCAPCARS